jgi:hypothetical protein
MAIYVNNIGDEQSLPLAINNPQPGDALVWSAEQNAYINAPGTTTPEQIQDTVAEMLDVGEGTQVSLRLVSNYDDALGKLTFNVVADQGGNGGGSMSSLTIQESGAVRGTATALNFVGPQVTITNNVATISGLLDRVGISDAGANIGDATRFNFVGFTTTVNNGIVTIVNEDQGGPTYTLPTASNSVLGGIKVGSGLTIDGQGVLTATGTSSLSWNSITDKPSLVTSYTQLTDKPTIPSLVGYATENYVNLRLSSYSLEDLADTYVTGVTDGQALVWNQANLRWQPGNAGSGGSYTLPTASTGVLGGVKVDGTTITINNGVISATGGGSTSTGVTIGDVGAYLTTNGYATQSYVQGQISNIVDGAPALLNTLNELSAALANNPNFATDVLLKSGGTMTGALTLSGAPTLDLQAATKKYVDDSILSIPAPTTNLNALTDVDTGGVATGQLLGWNGTAWVPTNNSGAKGDTGIQGPKGDIGLSISAATVTLGGRLQLTLSDNTVVDAGSVAGIKSAVVNGSGELVLTKQDNTTINVGSVIGPQGQQGVQGIQGNKGDTGSQGPAGVAVTSASVNNLGHLLVVKSDGTTLDAGSVVGAKGDQGIQGIQGIQGLKGDTGNRGDQGIQGIQGIQGLKGDQGDVGVGVSAASVNGSGHLIITKTDSSTVDAGNVVGPQGAQGIKGDTGAQGIEGDRGISVKQAVVENGNLLITLDDATQLNAGSVIGEQGPQGAKGDTGVSITSGTINGDDLILTKSDLTTFNAGNVRGLKGDTGAKGDTGNTGTISIGSVTTGAVGSSAVVTNSGTDTAATLNFTIPQGAKGDTGTSYTVNNKIGSVQVYGLGNTTQPGYDLEVDLANKANKWTTARTLTLSGKVTGLTSFDGSGNITMTTALNAVTTNDITEGTNKYYTDVRARAAHSSIADSTITTLISYDDVTGQIKYRANTSYITEGANLYFTNTRADTRADARIAASSINALSDVDTVTTAPTNGQVLTWTGSAWTPSSVAGGSGAVSSVNAKTGIVVLNTDDVSEGSANQYFTNTRWDNRLAAKTTDNLNQGTTNKYFSDSLARNAMAAGTGLTYNSATGTFSLSTSTSNVTEGSNLYYTSARFDTRLGQSNLNALADVADTTPTTGQALAWNGSSWAPTTISGGSGSGSSSSGLFRAAVKINYDASGNLTSVEILTGGISAVVATAAQATATVTFTFTGSACPPLSTMIYGYQSLSGANQYVTRALASDFSSRILIGGGSSGSPTAFSAFDSSVNTMTLSLTKALTGANAPIGQTTHCVVQFLLSNT